MFLNEGIIKKLEMGKMGNWILREFICKGLKEESLKQIDRDIEKLEYQKQILKTVKEEINGCSFELSAINSTSKD